MLRWSAPALLIPAYAAMGCAAPPTRPASTSADLGAWVDADEGAPRRSSTTLARPLDGPERAGSSIASRGALTLPSHAAPPPRPRRHGRVDVSFQKAEMGNAFQFLADTGHFNLVLQDGIGGHVSATMRGVDPYDALVALAEANGVEVRYQGDVVVVKKR
jgi:hypothetical protein